MSVAAEIPSAKPGRVAKGRRRKATDPGLLNINPANCQFNIDPAQLKVDDFDPKLLTEWPVDLGTKP